jgi:hypothetical protein
MTKPTEPGPGRVRASDGEREEYAQVLRAAMAEGRLTLEDGEERLAQAYAATYRDELDPLIADLPRGAAFRTPEYLTEARRRLRRHRNGVFSVAAVLTGIWLLVAVLAHPMFFWPIIPIAILTVGLFKHRRMYSWYAREGWGPRSRGWDGPPWARQGWSGPGGPGAGGPGWGPHAGGQGWSGHQHHWRGGPGQGRGWGLTPPTQDKPGTTSQAA